MSFLGDVVSDFAGGSDTTVGRLLGGIFGSSFDPYFRDGRNASKAFGQQDTYIQNNAPRLKFQYYVKINFNYGGVDDGAEPGTNQEFIKKYFNDVDVSLLIPLVKNIDMPSVSIETNKLNQYNKIRLSQNKINYEPINMTFYDVVDGKTLRFWEMYYEYYFKNGVNQDKWMMSGTNIEREYNDTEFLNDIVTDSFNNRFGYNIESVKNNRYLIRSIEILQIHASSFSKVELIYPRITSFSHDTLAYDQNQVVEMKYTLEYENLLYHNFYTPFDESDAEVFNKSEIKEITGPDKPRSVAVPHRSFAAPGKAGLSPADTDNSVLGNLERSVGGVLDSLPETAARALGSSIFTGEIEFPMDFKQIGRNLEDQVKRGATGTARSAVQSVARNFTVGVIDYGKSFLDNDRTEE